MRPRTDDVADAVFLATGQSLALVNSGVVDFAFSAVVPNLGITSMHTRLHADGTYSLLSLQVR